MNIIIAFLTIDPLTLDNKLRSNMMGGWVQFVLLWILVIMMHYFSLYLVFHLIYAQCLWLGMDL